MCHDKSICRRAVTGKCTSCIESEPSEPQQGGTCNGHRQVMRYECRASITKPFPNDQGSGKGRYAGTDVNHGSSCEIQGAHAAHPSSHAPYPMRQGVIDQRSPHNREKQKCAEFHALCKGSGDQCRCNVMANIHWNIIKARWGIMEP